MLSGAHQLLGLVASGSCPPPTRFTASLDPYPTLWECASANSYWDFRAQECRSCEAQADAAAACALGQYVPGCDALAAGGCVACPALGEYANWIPGTVCQSQCLHTVAFRGSAGLCVLCSLEELSCAPGSTTLPCTPLRDRQCGPCPLVKRGIYSDNEVWIVSDVDCATGCVVGTYNASFACLRCSSREALLQRATELSQPAQFWRLHACTATADGFVSACPAEANGHAVDHAALVGGPCAYACDEGFVRAGPACLPCARLRNFDGAELPDAAYTLSGVCNASCVPPYHAYNSTCWLCEAARCSLGEFLANCSTCAPCALRGPGWVFASAGLWDAQACQQRCEPGHWNDFGACTPHSALAALSCGPAEYVLNGTGASDTMCMPCQTCEGQNQTRSCTPGHNSACQPCPPLALDTHLGVACREACWAGRVLDVSANRCRDCDHACPPGSLFTGERQNCTDCRACPGVLGPNATWMAGCQTVHRAAIRFSQGRVAEALYALVRCNATEFVEGLDCMPCLGREAPAWPVAAELNVTWNFMGYGSECAWQCVPALYAFRDPSNRSRCVPWDSVKTAIAVEEGVVTGSFQKEFKHIQHKLPGMHHADLVVFVSIVVTTITLLATLWH